ncbi:MAG: tetratricopeptide repeat protein [Bacteroidales bacterium]|nr:tetratricopeptide repeat protein [Bacteroidales bacterium]
MKLKEIFLIIIAVLTITSCSSTKKVSEKKIKVKRELSESNELQYYYFFLEANRKKLLGDLKGALTLYYQCLEINPESDAAMSEISEINKIAKNYEKAEKYGVKAVEISPENKWYQLNLANLYIEIGNFVKAIEVYERLHIEYPNDLEITYALANVYSHIKNYNKAIVLYDKIEEVAGVSEQLAITKQRLYLQGGSKTKAYNEIEKLIRHYPSEPEFYGIMAEMYLNDNLFTKAEENYEKLFAIDSTNSLGQVSVIDFYRKKMNYEMVFVMLRTVIANKSTDFNRKVLIFVSLLNNQSEMSIYSSQIKENLLLLKKHYPKEKDTYTLYADFLIKMNLIKEAKTELEYITANYSSNVIVWEQLLSIYSYNNSFDTLLVASNTAIDSFPQHSLFYIFAGISATRLGKTDTAIQILQDGLKTTKNSPELEIDFYTYLGEAYYESIDYKKSDYYFDLVLERAPENLYVINNYSYYLSLREEKLEFAESISKKTILAEPKNSTYLDTYAWILFKLKRYKDALYYIKEAVENGGVDSEVIIEHYGDILFMTGDENAAIEFWKLSESLGNKSEDLLKKIKTKNIK